MLILPTDGNESPFRLTSSSGHVTLQVYPEDNHDIGAAVRLVQSHAGELRWFSIPVNELEEFITACRKAADQAVSAVEKTT